MSKEETALNWVLKKENSILSIFTTAGFPQINDTVEICLEIDRAGADLIEIGIPFSDPIADGQTIQHSSEVALSQGISLDKIFDQIKQIRKKSKIPILLMGYYNPVLQFGISRFLDKCSEVGVDGLIIPDLPRDEYLKNWELELKKRSISFVFLITPQTSEERIREVDDLSTSFIYAVSSHGVTGGNVNRNGQEEYYAFLQSLELKHPILMGFGIRDKESFSLATKYVKGAIVGSEFIRQIEKVEDLKLSIHKFIKSLR